MQRRNAQAGTLPRVIIAYGAGGSKEAAIRRQSQCYDCRPQVGRALPNLGYR